LTILYEFLLLGTFINAVGLCSEI